MIYLAAVPLFLATVALLIMGAVYSKPWALYLLKTLWVVLCGVALFFTVAAWRESSYSENWAMIGVIIIVWPIAGFVCLSVLAELLLLRRKRDPHTRLCRTLALLIASFLIVLSLSTLILAV